MYRPGWLQVLKLFPSAAGLKNTWHSIVKIGQSLYREAPGMDVFRPDQETPVRRFYMAGSFTKQVSATCHLNSQINVILERLRV